MNKKILLILILTITILPSGSSFTKYMSVCWDLTNGVPCINGTTTNMTLQGFKINWSDILNPQVPAGTFVYGNYFDQFLNQTSNVTHARTNVSDLFVRALTSASCDVKASTENGSLYCGTDATGAGGGGIISLYSTNSYIIVQNGTGTNVSANLTAFDLRYLQSYTETDPIFLANNASIYAALFLRLNRTDQQYNETLMVQAVNSTANTKAFPGTCAPGTVTANTTTSGVQCVADMTGGGGGNPSSAAGWTNDSLQTNTTLNVTINAPLKTINGHNITSNYFFGFVNWSWLINIPSYVIDWGIQIRANNTELSDRITQVNLSTIHSYGNELRNGDLVLNGTLLVNGSFNVTKGLYFGSLNSANCDVKAYSGNGSLYCGTDTDTNTDQNLDWINNSNVMTTDLILNASGGLNVTGLSFLWGNVTIDSGANIKLEVDGTFNATGNVTLGSGNVSLEIFTNGTHVFLNTSLSIVFPSLAGAGNQNACLDAIGRLYRAAACV